MTTPKNPPPQRYNKPAAGQALVAVAEPVDNGQHGVKKQSKDFVCVTSGCKYKNRHGLSDCRAFKKLSVSEKGQLVMEKKLCKLCLSTGHLVQDCPRKSNWKPCDIEQCGAWHSRMLHGAVANGVTLTVSAQTGNADAMLLVQEIPTAEGGLCLSLWDSGSTVSLVTFTFAEKEGLRGSPCHLDLGGVQGTNASLNTKLYCVSLRDRDGVVHNIFAFGVEKITSPIPPLNTAEARKMFPDYAHALTDRDSCQVELLIGIREAALHPIRIASEKKVSIFQSKFGTGCVLAGQLGAVQDLNSCRGAKSLLVRTREIKTCDFLSADALGVDIPKRCRVCVSCKECNFKSHQLTWKENLELTAIESGLELDTIKKVWTAEYPLEKDANLLKDNRNQVMSCMLSLEKRLKKVGQIEAFNQQFCEAVDRGVFRKLSQAEMKSYQGPVNYVSIVEAYKPGPHVTTPIRLCMNSSLKFCGLSLNDVLVKGPSSLNDIYAVMLGFRRYPVGLVMDVSKFYQSVLSCERDQHLRRILWRASPNDQSLTTYITTRVNFGDKPA